MYPQERRAVACRKIQNMYEFKKSALKFSGNTRNSNKISDEVPAQHNSKSIANCNVFLITAEI